MRESQCAPLPRPCIYVSDYVYDCGSGLGRGCEDVHVGVNVSSQCQIGAYRATSGVGEFASLHSP
jgi:hypothetical protein